MRDLLTKYPYLEAGNSSSREGKTIDGAVIHYTAGGSGGATARWARGTIGRSWHFIVSRDGSVIQQVKLGRAAWHAGRSEWPHSTGETISGANRYTVGIELANHGLLEKEGSRFYYEIAGQMFRYHGEPAIAAEQKYDGANGIAGWWEPYPEAQIEGLKTLLDELYAEGVPERIYGHSEIAMPFGQRKLDPGPLFPWDKIGVVSARRVSGKLIA